MSSITVDEHPSARKFLQDKLAVSDARALKTQTEQRIASLLTDFERATGCRVVDIGHWHNEYSDGVARVEMTVHM